MTFYQMPQEEQRERFLRSLSAASISLFNLVEDWYNLNPDDDETVQSLDWRSPFNTDLAEVQWFIEEFITDLTNKWKEEESK